jgi:16S rRNA (cytidine1402-2'-O)-methyltransferase
VVPIPGASALTAAISASGRGAGGFTFGGFLPKASEARQKLFAALAPGVHAYFVPARDLAEVATEMVGVQTIYELAIARELTKIFETFYRGAPAEVARQLAANPESGLGEAVLVFEVTASATDDAAITRALRSALATGASARDAAHTVAEALGIPRRRAYQLALSLPKEP